MFQQTAKENNNSNNKLSTLTLQCISKSVLCLVHCVQFFKVITPEIIIASPLSEML